jgi:hypothetical protein
VLAAATGPLSAQDSSYHPNPDQLAIHRATLRDAVRIAVSASVISNARVSLDPYVRAATESDWGPETGRRLSKEALEALLGATAIREVCEPVVRDACRGRIRGTVFRLTDNSLQGADSAQAIVLATAARSEFDRTILVPRVRYNVYQLERKAGEWEITKAQRGLTFLPPNVVSSSKP